MYLVDTGLKKDNVERLHKGWATVQRNVARIKSMVSDILYYAKDREPNWETLVAAAVVEEVCGIAEARAKDNDVELVLSVDPSAGEFEGDVNAVRALLTNLIENSVDACRLGGKDSDHRVDVRARGHADSVCFEIEDNGIGMDQETREKAFSLFFSSKGMEGTGLGLFVSSRIAQAHGGSIDLTSELGTGTQFVVTLPRKRPPQQEPSADESSETEAIDA